MGYETTTESTNPAAAGVGAGLTAASNTIVNFEKLKIQRDEAQANMQVAAAHMNFLNQQSQSLIDKRVATGQGMLGQTMYNAYTIGNTGEKFDPKAVKSYLDNNQADWQGYAKMAGVPAPTSDQLVGSIQQMEALSPGLGRKINSTIGAIDGLPVTSNDFSSKLAPLSKNLNDYYDQKMAVVPPSMVPVVQAEKEGAKKRVQDMIDRNTQYLTKVETMRMLANNHEQKESDKKDQEFNTHLNKFDTQNKSLIDNIDKDQQTLDLVTNGTIAPGQVGNFAAELAKRLEVKATTGSAERITEAMMKNLDLNPSTKNDILRVMARKTNNIALPADVNQLKIVAQLIDSSNKSALKSKISGYSKSVKGVDAADMEQKLMTRHSLLGTPTPAPGGKVDPDVQKLLDLYTGKQ